MENFPISPDDCLVLKAFKDSSSLREAAQLLACDPAGLTRKAQQISNQSGFLQKVNGRWQVTARGLDLVAWAEASIQTQKRILFDRSSLRIASTMWLSEEILIPNLRKLNEEFSKKTSFSLSVPSKSFEGSLIEGSVDFVVVCHPPENPEIEHKQIATENWVLIAPNSWKKDLHGKSEKILEELSRRPFVRHADINLDLLLPVLEKTQDADYTFDNLIGIRSAVSEGLGWSLVPRFLVDRHLKEKYLFEIPYDLPVTDRKVCLWWLRNRYETKRQSVQISSWLKEICS